MYGLANRMRAMMSCFLTAIASQRLLIVDWDHRYTFFQENEISDMPGGQPASLSDLFRTPLFDWSVDRLETVYAPEEIRGLDHRFYDDPQTRTDALVCSRLEQAWEQHLIVSFQAYFWSDLVLHNPHYEALFSRALGRDEMGLVGAWSGLGPLLFAPVPQVQEMVEAIGAVLLPETFSLGLHLRMGGNWYDQADKGRSRDSKLPTFLIKCGLAVLPQPQRVRPNSYLLFSDNSTAKAVARYTLQPAEGGERRRWDLTDERALDELGVTNTSHRKILSRLKVKAYEFRTGSRLVVVDREADRKQPFDVQQALAEVLSLGQTDRLVRSSGSTFVTAAYALFPKPTWYVSEKDLSCHRQSTSEPIANGHSYALGYTVAKFASCFDAKSMLNFAWVHTDM